MDHGYFKQSSRKFENNRTNVFDLDGYFRIVHNNFIHNGEGSFPNDRLNKLKLNFTSQKKYGKYIILSEPSEVMKKLHNQENWINETKKQIKKFSDREIIVHNKFSNIPLEELLKNAWAFVSFQSTAGFKAMLSGVPAFFTDKTLKKINPIEAIENPNINYNIFNNLAYGQWTLDEIKSGEAWETITKNI